MLQLTRGHFFGSHHQVVHLPGIIITDTQYTRDKVDWHYHQHPYFTFILQGTMLEVSKKERHECKPGTLLYHHWQDAHYNEKGRGYVRGFHIEIEDHFFIRYGINSTAATGSHQLDDPFIKSLFRKLHLETKRNDETTLIAVDELLLQVFASLLLPEKQSAGKQPAWVKKVKEALHDAPVESLSYAGLAELAGVHPVHLSRSFPKYFHATMGDYLRRIHIEKAVNLLLNAELSATEIGYLCGFADQSHFIRSFKQVLGITPLQYRKLSRAC
jgi:AraC family transcriptional regulator